VWLIFDKSTLDSRHNRLWIFVANAFTFLTVMKRSEFWGKY